VSPPDLTGPIRKVHDFLTVGPAAPLQQAGVLALGLQDAYYVHLSQEYHARRDHFVTSMQGAGFKCFMAHGAYYVMPDISTFGFAGDNSFVRHLITHVGVAAVPGSSFFAHSEVK
jgi:aspartate/methionine/tyrosine aminotransferase